jgi:hypothetical protein
LAFVLAAYERVGHVQRGRIFVFMKPPLPQTTRDVIGELDCGLVALLWKLLEALRDNLRQLQWRIGMKRRNGQWFIAENRRDHIGWRVPDEGTLPRKHLVEHHAA